MWKRIHLYAAQELVKLRPIIILVFCLVAGWSATQTFGTYLPEPAQKWIRVLSTPVSLPKSNKDILASITGEVANPGVYKLQDDSIVQDLLVKSGGLTTAADEDYIFRHINLARSVKAGEQVYIPARSPYMISTPISSPISDKININTAKQSELEVLPGIGAVTAQKIIEARPFSSVESLLDVSGIGDATYKQLIDYISI